MRLSWSSQIRDSSISVKHNSICTLKVSVKIHCAIIMARILKGVFFCSNPWIIFSPWTEINAKWAWSNSYSNWGPLMTAQRSKTCLFCAYFSPRIWNKPPKWIQSYMFWQVSLCLCLPLNIGYQIVKIAHFNGKIWLSISHSQVFCIFQYCIIIRNEVPS